MLWFLLFVGVVGVLVGLGLGVMSYVSKDCFDKDDLPKFFAVIFVIGAVFCLIGIFGLKGIKSMSYDEEYSNNLALEAITTDNNKVFLQISEQTNKIYYKVNNGELKVENYDVDTMNIYEKDGCTPYVIEKTNYTRNKIKKFWLFILAGG